MGTIDLSSWCLHGCNSKAMTLQLCLAMFSTYRNLERVQKLFKGSGARKPQRLKVCVFEKLHRYLPQYKVAKVGLSLSKYCKKHLWICHLRHFCENLILFINILSVKILKSKNPFAHLWHINVINYTHYIYYYK